MRIYSYIHAYIATCIHKYVRTSILTCICRKCVHKCMHLFIYISALLTTKQANMYNIGVITASKITPGTIIVKAACDIAARATAQAIVSISMIVIKRRIYFHILLSYIIIGYIYTVYIYRPI